MSDTLERRGSVAGIEDDSLYSVFETAAALGLHHHSIRRGIQRGDIKASRIGNGPWRILGSTIKHLAGAVAE